MNQCLNCEREFPDNFQEPGVRRNDMVEPGGNMLCLQCGHVMTWTDDYTLREQSGDEGATIVSNWPILRAVMKAQPARPALYPISSWLLTGALCLMLTMAALETVHVVEMPVMQKIKNQKIQKTQHPPWQLLPWPEEKKTR